MKKNYTVFLCLCLILLTSKLVISQNTFEHIQEINPFPETCITDEIHEKMMKSNEEYRNLSSKKRINTFTKNDLTIQQKINATNGIFQIPVVVHIMHLGEPIGVGTNISDLEIRKAIKKLNGSWRTLEGSIGDGQGVDMRIEYALAIQDENGNCTNGIERVDLSGNQEYVEHGLRRGNDGPGIPSYLDDPEINSLKEYSIWDPTQYYNIWVVKNIGEGSIAGFAFFASVHGRPFDGTVITNRSFVSETSSTFAHELGHAFSLFHTFRRGDDDTCSDDDGINDTPMHFTGAITGRNCGNTGVNTCDPNFNKIINPETGFRRNTGTHQDYLFNYMSSNTGCRNEFTGGQRTLVTNSLLNQRASFLDSKGLTPPNSVAVNFSQSASIACIDNTVSFTDTSSCIPNTFTNNGYKDISFLWSFNNGTDTPITSTLQNPTIQFTSKGIYNITLTVTTLNGSKSFTKTNSLVVTDNNIADVCTISSGNDNANFGIGVTNVKLGIINNNTSTFIPNGAMQNFICNNNTFLNLNTPTRLEITYRSRRDTQFLEVWIDWDASGTFERSNSNGIDERVLEDSLAPNLTNVSTTNITAPNIVATDRLLAMRVISNAVDQPNICGLALVQRADDYGIYVSNNQILSVTSEDTSTINIYPNPVKTNIILSGDTNHLKSYEIFDINGRLITSKNISINTINVASLPNGFYFIKLINKNNEAFIKRFIKI